MQVEAKEARTLPFVLGWVVLLVLAAISIASAFLKLGIAAPIVEFGIAAIQAAIVFVLFMRLKGPPSLKWLFAAAGFLWLCFLFGLSTADYATRLGWPSQ
jgi:caa(3)-type oxidase subunit IV